MASDNNTAGDKSAAKADPAPKAAEKAGESAAKTEASAPSDSAPASYSRGEGQKPISRAYRDNWSAIFGKKKKR